MSFCIRRTGVLSRMALLMSWDSVRIIRYFGRKPTSVTSESNVRIGESSMPWERDDHGGKSFKYQYHPNGDRDAPLRQAPSALNTVIVPNVTLPKVYDSIVPKLFVFVQSIESCLLTLSFFCSDRISMTALTSTARRSGTSKLNNDWLLYNYYISAVKTRMLHSRV